MVLQYTHSVKATYFTGEPLQEIEKEIRKLSMTSYQPELCISTFIKHTSDLIVSNPPKIKT